MIFTLQAPVAQGKEQPPSKRLAAGSNPARRTKLNINRTLYDEIIQSFFIVYIKPLAVPGVKAYSVIKKYPSFWFKINSRSANCEN